MKNFFKTSKKKIGRLLVLLVCSSVTIVFFLNCSKGQFSQLNKASQGTEQSSLSGSLSSDPSSLVNTSGESSSTASVVVEDTITPRIVFSATLNGPAQKTFKPNQKIYARAYGLSNKLENLDFFYTIVNYDCIRSGACVWSRDNLKANEIKKTFKFNPANNTWNFEFSLSFDQSRRIIIKDKTQVVLDETQYPTELALVQNTVTARSTPEEAKIIAVTDLSSMLKNSTTYGVVANQDLDFYTAYKYFVTGIGSGNIIYCAEEVGSNACNDRSKWQKASSDGYSALNFRQEILNITLHRGNDGYYLYDYNYRCGNMVAMWPAGKTIKYYAEETTTGVKAQATFTYGPAYDCGAYTPGAAQPKFGPG